MSTPKFLVEIQTTVSTVNVRNKEYLSLKEMCDILELDYDLEYQKISNDNVLSNALFSLPSDDDGIDQKYLEEKYVYGWLFQVESTRDDVVAYKNECMNAIYEGSFYM